MSKSAKKTLYDFAVALLGADSADAIGNAVLNAAHGLSASNASVYLPNKTNELTLFVPDAHHHEGASLPPILINSPHPLAQAFTRQKPLWLNSASPTRGNPLTNSCTTAYLPCCCHGQSYAVLKLVFKDSSADIKATSQQSAAEVASLTAQALCMLHQRHTLQNQKDHALQLLNMVSHDLRSPLSTLLLSIELLRMEGEAAGLVLKPLPRMSQALVQAQQILETLLNFNRLQLSEHLTIQPSAASIDVILRESLANLQKNAPYRQVNLTMAGHYEGEWDSERILLVFNQLLDNANRYAPSGDVIQLNLDARSQQILISIANARPVIPPEKLAALFEPAGRSRTSHVAKGLGLSLYIAKRLIELHQGEIEISSDEVRGTVVAIKLPRKSQAPTAAERN